MSMSTSTVETFGGDNGSEAILVGVETRLDLACPLHMVEAPPQKD